MNVLGISHLIAGGLRPPRLQGFEPLYDEEASLPDAKRPFLRSAPARHRIGFLKAGDGGVAIERVDHGLSRAHSAAAGPYSRGEDSSLPQSVTLDCGDVLTTAEFWERGFGFANHSTRDGQRLLGHAGSIVLPARKLLLRLAPVAPEPSRLDDEGFTCLCLLVTRVAPLLEALRALGAREIGEPFRIRADGRDFLNAFLRAPGGELIELSQVGPGGGRE